MPRHGDYNPGHARAMNFFVFPPNTYRLRISGLKPFARKKQDDSDSYGVRIQLVCTEGEFTGKKASFSAFLHTEGGQGIAKNVQMAAYGFDPRTQEEEFDSFVADMDWSFDTDTGDLGNGWAEMEGKELYGEFSTKMWEGKEQQEFKSWRPA